MSDRELLELGKELENAETKQQRNEVIERNLGDHPDNIENNFLESTIAKAEELRENVKVFEEFDNLTLTEKENLGKKYNNKATIIGLDKAIKGIGSVFISAGFATAMVYQNLTLAIVIGFLMLLTVGTLYYYLHKTSLPFEELSDSSLSEALDSAKQSSQFIDSSVSGYVCSNIMSAPFTLPLISPNVFVPKDTVPELTVTEHQAVFEHELGHHKNKLGTVLTTVLSIIPIFLIAPLLFLYTTLGAFELFVVLVVYGLSINIISRVIEGLDEHTADQAVSEPTYLGTSLVKLADTIPHAESLIDRLSLRLVNPHPPVNVRIKSITNNTINYQKSQTIKYHILTLSSVLFFTIGAIAIGYGFLTFTTLTTVPPTYLFYGTLSLGLSIVLQFVSEADTRLQFIGMLVGVSLSFLITVAIGYYLGANSFVDSVAAGRYGRRFATILIGVVIANLYLISPVWSGKKISPDDVESPEGQFISF